MIFKCAACSASTPIDESRRFSNKSAHPTLLQESYQMIDSDLCVDDPISLVQMVKMEYATWLAESAFPSRDELAKMHLSFLEDS